MARPQVADGKTASSKTFKNAYVLKCVIVYWKATRKNYELVSKTKIELHLFQQYFTPHTPPLKQGESETTLSPDLPAHASYAQQFLSVNVSNLAAQCQIS